MLIWIFILVSVIPSCITLSLADILGLNESWTVVTISERVKVIALASGRTCWGVLLYLERLRAAAKETGALFMNSCCLNCRLDWTLFHIWNAKSACLILPHIIVLNILLFIVSIFFFLLLLITWWLFFILLSLLLVGNIHSRWLKDRALFRIHARCHLDLAYLLVFAIIVKMVLVLLVLTAWFAFFLILLNWTTLLVKLLELLLVWSHLA